MRHPVNLLRAGVLVHQDDGGKAGSHPQQQYDQLDSESIGKGRFGDWIENVQDWGISRNRYWGTPLNVWECECGHQHAVGSRQELVEMSGNPEAANVELHRPYIDEITVTCPKCGKPMKRVPEVIDCWFDSGSMPFAQHHYPFENKEVFKGSVPGRLYFRGGGSDQRLVLFPAGDFNIAFQ